VSARIGSLAPGSLWEALESGSGSSSLHCLDGEGAHSATWSEVAREARQMTAGMRRAGVVPGARVAAVLTNGPQVVRGILGVWLCGGAVASLPVPARGMDIEEYARQLTSICEQLGPVMLVIEEHLLGLLPESLCERVRVRAWESFAASGSIEPSPPQDDELAFIQYSSGSTSAPKGCMLSPRAIAAQLELVREMIEGRPGREVTVSWLPLSHDMGMFGCLLTPWVNDWDLYLSTPERFAFSPRTWFGDMARFGGTMTAGTNTALYMGARASRRRLEGELAVRACIIGAERVEWQTLRLAVEALGPYGLREEALMPAYGMAEATLALTATPAREAPRRVVLDAVALADGELRELDPSDPVATSIVSAGRPCAGVELVGAGGERVSELRVRSPSLASGYLSEPQLTRERFRDGELVTGDLGFVRDGHLYPVGRVDDVISVAGRNVYAREIETAVDMLAGVRRGCSTIVEQRDGARARLTLLLESGEGGGDYRALADSAASVAMAKAAVPLDECVFLERGSLPKTPSGKIQRHRCRQMLAEDSLSPLARISLASG
jgi:fatty-acyl-CoA synthase